MRLLNYFRRARKDDFWGEMRLEIKHCECFKIFAPTDTTINIWLDTKGDPPNEAQKEFVLEIERRYQQLLPTIHSCIAEEVQKWKTKYFDADIVADMKKEFIPVFLNIPDCKKAPTEWFFPFSPQQNYELFVTMFFSDLQVTKVISNGR